MHGNKSPIRHDYSTSKPLSDDSGFPLQKYLWFAVGLGLPLLVVMFAVSLKNKPLEISPELSEPAMQATLTETDQAPLITASLDESISEIVVDWPRMPTFESLKLVVKKGDTLDQMFRRNDLSVGDLMTIANLEEAKAPLRRLKPGDELMISHDGGRVMSLTRHLGIDQSLSIARSEDGTFSAALEERPVEYRQTRRHGVIKDSLFLSAAEIGLSDRVIMNIAGIFAWDIDFVYDIRSGDEYYVIFEELWQDGKKVEDGEIIAAEFVNQGESFKAIRYVKPNGDTDYFDQDGRSVRKAFVRAPVDFRRISSAFNPNRRHPVLNTIRAHRGVDYSAPTGTPIMAAGDGKIIARETQRGYGKVVILQHGGNITTLYAHMSNFRKGQRVGSRVKQGQVIGFVGATGMVTGAHLHYEYRINGVHRNPRTVALPQASPIAAEHRADFDRVTKPILAELDQFKRLQIASSDSAITAL
ncbi:MAG: OapA family protein [Woeseiaceae bacterium]